MLLSILEREQGLEQGIERSVVAMLRTGKYSPIEIATDLDLPLEKVQSIKEAPKL